MFSPVSIIAVTAVSSVLSILILASLLPHRIAGSISWLLSNVLAVLSLTLFAAQNKVPPFWGIVVANQLLAATILLILEGCNRFFGVRHKMMPAYTGWLLVLAGIVYFTYVKPDTAMRVVVVSVFHGGIDFAIAARVLACRPRERPQYSYYFLIGAALLSGCGHAVRGTTYLFSVPAQSALLQPSAMQMIFLALGILALPSLCIGLAMMAHDRLAERLERLARYDDLTGTLTRRAFLDAAADRIEAARRGGASVCIAVIDIDLFKNVNDQYGHPAGDEVLRHFTALVRANIRGEDCFGRTGGEEFCLVCSSRRPADVKALVQRLCQVVAESPCMLKSGPLHYTFSAGVECWNGVESLERLLARADLSLYDAKEAGRNRVVTSAAFEAAAQRRTLHAAG